MTQRRSQVPCRAAVGRPRHQEPIARHHHTQQRRRLGRVLGDAPRVSARDVISGVIGGAREVACHA